MTRKRSRLILLAAFTTIIAAFLNNTQSTSSRGQSFFASIDSFLMRTFYQKYAPAKSEEAPITLIIIKEGDLDRFGPWPWEYSVVNTGLQKLFEAQPTVVGVALPPHSTLLPPVEIALPVSYAEEQKSTQLVLGFDFAYTSKRPFPSERIGAIDKARLALDMQDAIAMTYSVRSMPVDLLVPEDELIHKANYLGFLNYITVESGAPDFGLVELFDVSYYKSFPLALVEAHNKADDHKAVLSVNSMSAKTLQIGAQNFALNNRGAAYMRYHQPIADYDNRPFANYRFRDLVDGKIPIEHLENRIVVLGQDITSEISVPTPFKKTTSYTTRALRYSSS